MQLYGLTNFLFCLFSSLPSGGDAAWKVRDVSCIALSQVEGYRGLGPGMQCVSERVAGQFDVEAALRRHVKIPRLPDRRYEGKLTHCP